MDNVQVTNIYNYINFIFSLSNEYNQNIVINNTKEMFETTVKK